MAGDELGGDASGAASVPSSGPKQKVKAKTQAEIEAGVRNLAARNHGIISRKRALEAGLKRSRIDGLVSSGRWEAVYEGVYRIAGSVADRGQRIASVLAWAGEGAVLSHHTAAEVWGFEGIKAPPVDVHVSRVNVGKSEPRGLMKYHRVRKLPPTDQRKHKGFLLTSPLRTIVDLAAVLADDELERVILSASRKKLLKPSALIAWERAGAHRGIEGLERLRRVLERQAILLPTESPLEDQVLQMLVDERLHPNGSQATLYDAKGRIGRMDFALVHFRILIEVDGRSTHDLTAQRALDEERDRRTAAVGFVPIRIRHEHLTGASRRAVVAQIDQEIAGIPERSQADWPYWKLVVKIPREDGTLRTRTLEHR